MIDTAADRLRRVADALRAGKPVSADDASPLADAFEAAIDRRVDLAEALGLIPPSRHSVNYFGVRSQLVGELARHYTGAPTRIAKDIAIDAVRYAASTWRLHQHTGNLPVSHVGKPEALFWQLLRNHKAGGAPWPVSWRTVYDILLSQNKAMCLQSGDVAIAKTSGA